MLQRAELSCEADQGKSPNRNKDPLAWLSFQEAWQTLPKNDEASDGKESGGPWLVWFNAIGSA